MKEIRLNGTKMVDKASTHSYLKEKLELPDYYGENLDALWDCISTDFSSKKIILSSSRVMIENLGPYGESLLEILQEAASENEFIEMVIEN